jgi:transposase
MSTVVSNAQAGRDPAGLGGLRGRIARLEDENAVLRDEQRRLEAERDQLRVDHERLRVERDRLQEINERLRGEVEALRRAAKRQAAPFSRGEPEPNPKRSGRRSGAAYGTRAYRPPPEQVDQVVTVELPACCPGCGGELVLERVATQHVEELPPTRPLVTCYQIQVGCCRSCGRRVQPRHPGQTSDALGAAGTQVGPRAVALAAWLSKGLGLPAGKITRLFAQLGLRITAGGVTQAVARAGRALTPTYQALVERVRASPVVAGDETGWRVGGARRGCGRLSASASRSIGSPAGGATRRPQRSSARTTPGRSNATAGRPTAALSTRPTRPAWRTCCGACGELVADADRGQAKTPHAVRRLLAHALWLRDARDARTLDAATLAAEAGRLGAKVDKLIAGATRYPPNRRLLDHLARERAHLFTFLGVGGVQATNWRAEQAIRPAVVARKVWGGNRTWAGADTWQVLTSVLRTASQQDRDAIELLACLLRVPVPIVADLAIPGR